MPKFSLLALLLLAGAATAQTQDSQLRSTQAMLDAVREEQHAVYQQFQMIQSLQQAELQSADPAAAIRSPRPDSQL